MGKSNWKDFLKPKWKYTFYEKRIVRILHHTTYCSAWNDRVERKMDELKNLITMASRNFWGKRNFKEKCSNIILYVWKWPYHCHSILSQAAVCIPREMLINCTQFTEEPWLEDLFIAKYSKNSILLQNIRNSLIYSLKECI